MVARKQEKKMKQNSTSSDNKKVTKPFKKSPKDKSKVNKLTSGVQNTSLESKRERRIRAKELAEARKKKRKRHYTLEQELASLWEKMRQRHIAKEDRSKYISEALQKMKGKIPEIATSHVSSRVLQTCVKNCSQIERDSVFAELKPHFLNLSCNTYAVHLINKLLDNASAKQKEEFIANLRGHVASLLRHMVGSVVVEHAYQNGNASQKQELMLELYSTELQLFKDLSIMKETRLLDVISKLKLQKASVVRHMTSVIQPILEKGIVDHSIIHRLLIEYLSIADKSSAAEVIQQLSGPLLVRMIHTKDGSKIGVLCVKYGSAKERKKIIKGMKGHVVKMAQDRFGNTVLSSILSTVDDTKVVTKTVIRELLTSLKDLVLDKFGRRPLLQLLHPDCSRYFDGEDMTTFNFSISSLSSKRVLEVKSETNPSKDSDEEATISKSTETGATETASSENGDLIEGGKKDPSVRRQELLIGSGLAEKLIEVCTENAGELLRSRIGREVLCEAATGGAGGILRPVLDDKLNALYEAIASLAAEPKSEESEHILENFFSSWAIKKLILDCSPFATTLWMKALKGKCALWAQGHSSKVIRAFLESPDAEITKLVNKELQPLINVLQARENEQPEKEGSKNSEKRKRK